jgi:hypothetical protein
VREVRNCLPGDRRTGAQLAPTFKQSGTRDQLLRNDHPFNGDALLLLCHDHTRIQHGQAIPESL